MHRTGTTRRTFLRAAGLGVAATFGAPALISCSSSASGGSDVGNAGKDLVPWPDYVPFNGPTPDLPGDGKGVDPGYLTYPDKTVASVAEKPGTGQDVTAMVITYMPPPTPVGKNQLWQAVNDKLGVNLRLNIVPAADFANKMSTVMAGGDLPDIICFGPQVFARVAQFLASQCADLSDHLSGAAVKDYPSLANIPRYAWEGAPVRVNGKLYGVPITRSRAGNILMINRTALEQAGASEDDIRNWDLDRFREIMTAANGKNHWSLGANIDNRLGAFFHPSCFGAPNLWKVNKDGTFVSSYETDEYAATVAALRGFYKAGLYNPDERTLSGVDAKTRFYNGKILSLVDGPIAYQTAIPLVKDDFTVDVGRLYHAAENAAPWLGTGFFGYAVFKKASADRIKMLLRVVNYLTAPFGSAEYELSHFGVEGKHFKRTDGGIEKLPLADTENSDSLPIRYIGEAPPVIYYPGNPEATKRQYAFLKDDIPNGITNPAQGLISATNDSNNPTMEKTIAAGFVDAVTGRKSLSAYADAIKAWRSAGGAKVAEEFAKEYAAKATEGK